MYLNVIRYKGELIASNSYAAELHAAKKWKELNEHLEMLHTKWLKESGRDPKEFPISASFQGLTREEKLARIDDEDRQNDIRKSRKVT